MDIGKFVRSLKPGDDRALAARDYAGQQSASEKAAADRRRRHRKEVAEMAAKTRKDARRDPRAW